MLTRAHPFRVVATLLGKNQEKRLALLESLTDEQWLAAIAEANEHLVGPTLYAEALERQWLHLVPGDVQRYLAEQHRPNVIRNRRIREQLVECLECLNAASIVPLLLKGAAAAPNAQDLGARIVGDIDLLIPKDELERAAHELRGLGYRPWTLERTGRHAFGVLERPGDPAALDLHREIMEPPHLLPASSFWSDCTRVQFGRGQAFVPSRRQQLLHVAMHEMVHHGAYSRGFVGLRALHDFSRAASDLPDGWPALWDDLARRSAIAPFTAMAYVAERLLETPLPAIVRRGAAPRVFHLRAALRRAGLLPHRVNQVWMYAHIALARYYFNPEHDMPSLAVWRIRRFMHFVHHVAVRLWPAGRTA
jgi:hypothetical protein